MKKWWIIISLASAFAFQFAHADYQVQPIHAYQANNNGGTTNPFVATSTITGTFNQITVFADGTDVSKVVPVNFKVNGAGDTLVFFNGTAYSSIAGGQATGCLYDNTASATTSISISPGTTLNFGGDSYSPAGFPGGIYTDDSINLRDAVILSYSPDCRTPAPGLGGTRITSVEPFPGSTVATSSPTIDFNAIGYIASPDVIVANSTTTGLSISWTAQGIQNNCIDAICAFNSTPTASARTPVDVIVSGSQTFDVSATVANPFNTPGVYTMTTELDRPTSILGFNNLFGFTFGYQTIVSTTSTFTVGTTTSLGEILLNARNQGILSTTTSAYLSSCIPIPGTFVLNDCVNALFVPKSIPSFANAFSAIANKPPFGYFTAINNALSGATTTTASTTLQGSSVLTTLLTPIRLMFEALLWFLFALWIFHRIREWNFQS